MDKIFKILGQVPINILIDKGIKNYVKDLALDYHQGAGFLVVSDKITFQILGEKVIKSLKCVGSESYIIEQERPIADIIEAEKIADLADKFDAIIAIGSGTINDLCKYASYLKNKPYIVFATAPSMNGYCSSNASISFDGFKSTVKAHLPKAVFCDIDILSQSPLRLIQSGLGDSICRPTAQADWLLSHLILDTKYDERPFEALKIYEDDLFNNSAELISRSPEIIELLMQTLVTSGLGMNLAGDSSPASQAEHMIAHTMQMSVESESQAFHGEEIAVTTSFMAKMIENILDGIPTISVDYSKKEILDFLGEEITNKSLEQYQSKLNKIGNVDLINEKIQRNWGEINNKISDILINKNSIDNILQNANIITNPEHIGWNINHFNTFVKLAKYTRNRFTFLDFNQPD